jgi:CBS domain-containing protein
MLIREVMTSPVEVIHPDAPLQEAAQKMMDLDVGPLPVCDGDRLVGMLTDRDITIRATARGCDPKTTPVRAAMTPELVYCFDDRDVREAARLMENHQIRRLPVVDRNKRLVGIVSLGDISVRATQEPHLDEEILEEVSEPAASAGGN